MKCVIFCNVMGLCSLSKHQMVYCTSCSVILVWHNCPNNIFFRTEILERETTPETRLSNEVAEPDMLNLYDGFDHDGWLKTCKKLMVKTFPREDPFSILVPSGFDIDKHQGPMIPNIVADESRFCKRGGCTPAGSAARARRSPKNTRALDLESVASSRSNKIEHMDSAIGFISLATLMLLLLCPKAESHWISHHPLPKAKLPPLCASQIALANRACSVLPYRPIPPPSPPPEESHHHHRLHHHGHWHNHKHNETNVEEDCCRWLHDVDDACVCWLLLHLSPFLTRPAHDYTVFVDESCQVTFSCGTRWVPL